jgi:DnaJ-class molecular chaperone
VICCAEDKAAIEKWAEKHADESYVGAEIVTKQQAKSDHEAILETELKLRTKTCPFCKGKGYSNYTNLPDARHECFVCYGTGRTHKNRQKNTLISATAAEAYISCSACSGLGIIQIESALVECKVCAGTGYVDWTTKKLQNLLDPK